MRISLKVFVAVYLLFLVACDQNTKDKLLTGKWMVILDVESFTKDMSEKERDVFSRLPDSLSKQKIEHAQRVANKNIFLFNEDKTFELILKEEEIEQKGTWQLLDDGITLRLTLEKLRDTDKEKIDDLTIRELSTERLIVIYKDTDGQLQEFVLKKLGD